MAVLQAHDPLPGLRVVDPAFDWAQIQLRMRDGVQLSPLLPLGGDAGLVWVPKNGCSTLKRVWLQLQGADCQQPGFDPHSAALPSAYWLNPDELRAVSEHRSLVAIWRDPIDRFVSACRSHLVELTTAAVHAKLRSSCPDQSGFENALRFHDELFAGHGVGSFADDADPVDVMNQAALQLPAWIACHIDWSHHTIPQISFLGGDPRCYRTILGMEQIDVLVAHWSKASGLPLDLTPQHVSREEATNNPWRRLRRDQLSSEALAALERFYAADWAFLELAQQQLGAWQAA
ncbi:sulfotransferase family 2 domain-containing protein [Synechococcus sp. Minos11]|uniref:sulfotransferase family 2 domain-containing protein n=1 Tax=Synechococcus sp. Minos11 TaxID=221341 RepID=UPI0016446564|nr:sulfotransferase family 2 domain-containing protein [Synechococcus sp. Minos11]